MKNITKYKIIQWVTKMLKYEHPIHIPMKEESRKIQKVQWTGILYEWDVKHDLESILVSKIAKEMSDKKSIKINTKQISDHEYEVNATAYFIEPLTI